MSSGSSLHSLDAASALAQQESLPCVQPLVFVVDDDPAMARLLRYTLEAEDCHVRTFCAASQVLRQGTRPNVFLLDRDLPDRDGLELCAYIRQNPLWAGVPVIFVSGKSSEKDRVEGLKVASDYIAKPFSPSDLVARVHAVLACAHKSSGSLAR